MGQDLKDRLKRLKKGDCPIHGIGMHSDQNNEFIDENDNFISSYTISCPRKDCSVEIEFVCSSDDVLLIGGPDELKDMMKDYFTYFSAAHYSKNNYNLHILGRRAKKILSTNIEKITRWKCPVCRIEYEAKKDAADCLSSCITKTEI